MLDHARHFESGGMLQKALARIQGVELILFSAFPASAAATACGTRKKSPCTCIPCSRGTLWPDRSCRSSWRRPGSSPRARLRSARRHPRDVLLLVKVARGRRGGEKFGSFVLRKQRGAATVVSNRHAEQLSSCSIHLPQARGSLCWLASNQVNFYLCIKVRW